MRMLPGPILRRHIPRVAMLATVTGVAIMWIASKGMFDVYASPLLGLPVLIIALLGLIGGYKLPRNIPPLVVSLLIGVAMALSLGEAKVVLDGVGKLYLPCPAIGSLLEGFKYILPYLNIIIPIEIYNFIETMDNVESAKAAGDNYSVAEAQLADGGATMLAAVFGGIIPNTVWMGHPGLKKSGCKIGFAWVSGVGFAAAAMLGVFTFLYNITPMAIVAIVFVWCAMVMSAQAYVDTPRRHAAAVCIAMLPHIANYAYTQITSTLRAVGITEVTEAVAVKLTSAGVLWDGIVAMNYGAVLTGLMWATMVAAIIDRQLKKVAVTAFVAAGFSFFGMIHAPIMGINACDWHITIGYISIAGICLLVDLFKEKLIVETKYDYV